MREKELIETTLSLASYITDQRLERERSLPFSVNKCLLGFAPLCRARASTTVLACQYPQDPIGLATNECLLVQDLLTYRSRLETDRYGSRRLCLEIIDSNLIRGPRATERTRLGLKLFAEISYSANIPASLLKILNKIDFYVTTKRRRDGIFSN